MSSCRKPLVILRDKKLPDTLWSSSVASTIFSVFSSGWKNTHTFNNILNIKNKFNWIVFITFLLFNYFILYAIWMFTCAHDLSDWTTKNFREKIYFQFAVLESRINFDLKKLRSQELSWKIKNNNNATNLAVADVNEWLQEIWFLLSGHHLWMRYINFSSNFIKNNRITHFYKHIRNNYSKFLTSYCVQKISYTFSRCGVMLQKFLGI